MRSSRRFTVALAVASLSALFATASAFAQQVGTATAVNPLSESTPPGGTTGPLIVGAHIVHKERVHTTPAGTVQLLFTDKSSMSIAPNTDIVIDEYVYDPNANTGHMLVSLTKGALRFVGGQLSHQGAATITTSAANIGIRGGTVTVIQGQNGTKVINVSGIIKIVNGAGTFLLTRSDFGALIAELDHADTGPGAHPPWRGRLLSGLSDEQVQRERRRAGLHRGQYRPLRHRLGARHELPAGAVDAVRRRPARRFADSRQCNEFRDEPEQPAATPAAPTTAARPAVWHPLLIKIATVTGSSIAARRPRSAAAP